ncbi:MULTISPECIES: hypothetical protein [unclassified Bradyrhizobium]|uniref:hypothetical protein n=1 Tax=unclassified Bradyrhizobium TaxID=2631580 RepID=UPI0024E171D2|nr:MULTISPECIES: hypothetical protein [unclassified Bradyrhizobium]
MLKITPRRKRWLKLTSARWQRRVLFVAGGLVVGAAAVALTKGLWRRPRRVPQPSMRRRRLRHDAAPMGRLMPD